MIRIGEEKKLSRVVISTAFGHSGGGMFPYFLFPSYRRLLSVARETKTTIFSKSATILKRRGNFISYNPLTWKYIQRIPGTICGMINAYGLTNDGTESCAKQIWYARQKGFQVIPNFFPTFADGPDKAIEDTLRAVGVYRSILLSNFRALELNYSCPNSGECIIDNMISCSRTSRAVRQAHPDLFLVAKVSLLHSYEFCQEQVKAGVNAIHAINTIPYGIVCPNSVSPLLAVGGGGVSGDPAFEKAYEYNRELRKRVNIPLIMGCGVRCVGDVYRYFDIGADSVSLCSLAIRDSAEAKEILTIFNRQ